MCVCWGGGARIKTKRADLHPHHPQLGNVHYEWLARYVIVSFRMYGANVTVNSNRYMDRESDNSTFSGENALWQFGGGKPTTRAVQELTEQCQNTSSPLYHGEVTKGTDKLWGVIALDWDVSLRLQYAIRVVGGVLVQTADQNNDKVRQRICVTTSGNGNSAHRRKPSLCAHACTSPPTPGTHPASGDRVPQPRRRPVLRRHDRWRARPVERLRRGRGRRPSVRRLGQRGGRKQDGVLVSSSLSPTHK